ncbi:hypothetical protein Tco_0644367 [Tanacetum coccineum]
MPKWVHVASRPVHDPTPDPAVSTQPDNYSGDGSRRWFPTVDRLWPPLRPPIAVDRCPGRWHRDGRATIGMLRFSGFGTRNTRSIRGSGLGCFLERLGRVSGLLAHSRGASEEAQLLARGTLNQQMIASRMPRGAFSLVDLWNISMADTR